MKVNINNSQYKKHLKDEAELWNKAAKEELKNHSPDYKYYQRTLPYRIYRHSFVLKMLEHINSEDRVLELGSYNGWFTLEMARKGAHIDAHDIASKAVNIAKTYYKKSRERARYKGTIHYHVTDLNNPVFPENMYDVVVIRNVLHHIVNLELLFEEMDKSLKPGGKILVDDGLPVGRKEALIAGIFLLLLPTDIPYHQKLQRVFKKKNILKRTQDLMDAKDASPFEGITGAESVEYLRHFFKVKHYSTFAAFIGTLSAKVELPLVVKYSLLKFLNLVDIFLIKIRLLQGTVYFSIAQKK